jgi:hypothetical protein
MAISKPKSFTQPLSCGDRRAAGVFATLGMIAFGIACAVNPYSDSGTALTHGSHTQVGLPACGFYKVTSYPCPGCGLTTSFALIMRGDVESSLIANEAGVFVAGMSALSLLYFAYASTSGRALTGIGVDKPLVWLVCASVLVVGARYATVLYSDRFMLMDSLHAMASALF